MSCSLVHTASGNLAVASIASKAVTNRLSAVRLLPVGLNKQIPDLCFTTAKQQRRITPCVVRATSGAGGFGSGGSGSSGGGGSGGSSGSGDGSQNHPMRLWTFLYAALLAGGGIMAYVKKGSTKSLTSALGSALILALSARAMAGPQVKGSLAVCLAIAVLLSVIMAGRYSRTRKMMPAGVTAGVSLAMSAAYLGFLFQ